MKKTILFIAAIIISSSLYAQESTLQTDYAGTMLYNSQQVISLAEAIPEDKYSWSPAEGVRSTADVIKHVISANYFFGMLMGAEPAEGIDPMSLGETLKTKEEILAALKSSFDYISKAGESITEVSMIEMVDFPGGQKVTRRTAMLVGLSHCSEHKGQLIAYARMNGITPPWSE